MEKSDRFVEWANLFMNDSCAIRFTILLNYDSIIHYDSIKKYDLVGNIHESACRSAIAISQNLLTSEVRSQERQVGTLHSMGA